MLASVFVLKTLLTAPTTITQSLNMEPFDAK
jgi:hypothetical protein